MKKSIPASAGARVQAVIRMSLSLLLTAALATSLWLVTLPAARAREMTAREMIEEGLPPGKTMQNGSKPELLAAICAAVKKHHEVGPEISRTAVSAHHEFAGDVVATVLRCNPAVNCDFVRMVVAASVRVAPSEASVIDDAALAIAPDCADSIQASTGSDGKEVLDGKDILDAKDVPAEGPAIFGGGAPTFAVPFPGSIGGGGGGFDPQDPFFLICDNGTQRQVRRSQLADFFASHPGSFVGSCQPTPTTNQ